MVVNRSVEVKVELAHNSRECSTRISDMKPLFAERAKLRCELRLGQDDRKGQNASHL